MIRGLLVRKDPLESLCAEGVLLQEKPKRFGDGKKWPGGPGKGVPVKIEIDPHTVERARERGTNEIEIKDVIESGSAFPAKYGRIGKSKVYRFGKKRHGKYYEQKRVEVVYNIEGDIMVTVTVYVFYGKWEEE